MTKFLTISTNKLNRGFTLLEMAVVLIIVGFLLGGLLVSLSAQMDMKSRNSTEQSIENIKEAILGFSIVNGYLPCPDSSAVPTGVEGARDANGGCLVLEGTLPWQTLAVARTDAWDKYFRYRVSSAFANSGSGSGIKFGLGSTGNITIKSDVGQFTTTAIAVIVSHGGNGFGAKNTIQTSPENDMPAPAGADELENTNSDSVFVSHIPTPRNSGNEFDDVVAWISPNIVFNRMVAAGKLP